MNTRQAIQQTDSSAVLSISFSYNTGRFAAALTNGIRVYRTDNCITSYTPPLPQPGGCGLVQVLDDRYLAWVGGGRSPSSKPSIVIFWDAQLNTEVTRFDFHEPVLGLRLHPKHMLVILHSRAVLFKYQEIRPGCMGPNKVVSVIDTAPNPRATGCLHQNLLILPAVTQGQVQLISFAENTSKRIHRAHNSAVTSIAISLDGALFATASEQGTLVRVFAINPFDQIAEFRRGVDPAIIYNLAFAPDDRWLACTSDKGTLHIFDLKPGASSNDAQHPSTVSEHASHTRKSQSHRYSDSLSGVSSDRSSPSTITGYQGSVQEYYGLRPPPKPSTGSGNSASPVSAFAALKASPFAPRIFKDARSTISAPFYIGDDSPYWQGGTPYSWTTTPNGTRKRVTNPVPPRPGDPSGKPPKGIIMFERMDGPAGGVSDVYTLYIVGGGSDARWEKFQLIQPGNTFTLINCGFRKYLTRQFVD